jgi:hypothetical protein
MFANRRAALARAYPGITFRPHTLGWLARFMRAPAECTHLETEHAWMAGLVPDAVWLKGKARAVRHPPRLETSLCRACLLAVLEPELARYEGRVIFFEPDPENLTQYFFVSAEHFDDAYLQKEVARALKLRLADRERHHCAQPRCPAAAKWLWFSAREVASLEEAALIEAAQGRRFCARHGAAQLAECFRSIAQANLEYVNLPYGESGAYLWF